MLSTISIRKIEQSFHHFAELLHNEIIKTNGANHYKIPHMNKAALEQLGQLPVSLAVTEDADIIWGVEAEE